MVQIRLTDHEAEVLRGRAELAGVTVQRYLVEAGMTPGELYEARHVDAGAIEVIAGASAQLAHVGRNLNQLIRLAHTEGLKHPHLIASIEDCVRTVRWAIREAGTAIERAAG